VSGNICQNEHVSDHESMADVVKKDVCINMNYLL
jgi:hypothetical protein